MYNHVKRIFAFLLCLTILTGLFPFHAHAEEPAESGTFSEVHVNPLYRDIITEEELFVGNPVYMTSAAADSEEYLTTIAEAGLKLRTAMKARQETCTIYYQLPSYDSTLPASIVSQAVAHTGVPTEGDYLMWQYGGYRVTGSYYTSGGVCYITLNFALTYYTTAEQEAEMDTAVAALLKKLSLDGASDYEKIKGIYNHLCENITYDYANLYDKTYLLKHTAYAALINKTSVCQGYAVLFYRLALSLGVDCRVITGVSSNENHAWNIAKLDGLYYNLDATWDAGRSTYSYFLCGSEDFPDHSRNSDYSSTSFHSAYPTSTLTYDPDQAGGSCTHNYVAVIVRPTCTLQGYTTYTCSVCSDSYVDDYVDAKGHTPVIDKALDATCTASGLTEGSHCSVCSAVITKQEGIPAKGHTPVTDKATPATCTESGLTEGSHCSVCDAVITKQEVVPAKGHSPITDAAVAATCTNTGLTEGSHCGICDTVITKQEVVPVTDHSWGEWSVIQEATEQNAGEKRRECVSCGLTDSASIPPLEHTHSYTSAVTDPTCTAQGYTTHSCSCGYSYQDTHTAPTGHTPVTDKAVDATCTDTGLTEGSHCSVCDAVIEKQEVVAAKGHTPVIDEAVDATCTSTGLTEGSHCSLCDTVITKQEVVPILLHSYQEEVTKPTCTKTGYTTYTCTVCGDSYVGDETEALPHDYASKVTAPTCTQEGYTVYICSGCGESHVDDHVPATDHSFGEWTLVEAGLERRNCTNCDHYETREVETAKPETPKLTVSGDSTSGKPKLKWGKVDGAEKYQVYRKIGKNGTYKKLATVTGTSHIDSTAEAGIKYYYRIRAVAADGTKSSYCSGKARTCDLPKPVVEESNVSSSGAIKLKWDKIDGAETYKIYRRVGKSGSYEYYKTTSSSSYTDNDTTPGIVYYYKVLAVHSNTSANSAKSSAVGQTCQLPRPVVEESNVSSSGAVKLEWDKIDGAEAYKIYRRVGKSGSYEYYKSTTSNKYTDNDTTPGIVYYYKVVAVHSNTNANSANSSAVGQTCKLERPDVSIKLSSGNPKLTWDEVEGAKEYNVYRATSKNGTYKLVKTTASEKFTDKSVKEGKTYYYKVKAIHSNASANSAYSSIDSIKAS